MPQKAVSACPSPVARPFLQATILLVLLLPVGCGRPPAEPAALEIPGYGALQESLTGRDFTPLRGRRIVLDPGHGGHFRGAVGPRGLTEAEVNLGVGLHLRGLLEWAGAEVHLTRTADYDFLTPADSSLASDLAFRVSITDSLQPDVFLSLHHNSTASLDPTINETQTYYPLGAEGASLDLARSIHRHLALNLEITPANIMPGNFHVLRNTTVPAVLGEPAMISHPVIEGRLTLAASHRLEAEAYFLGLLDYFADGSPRWAGARVDTVHVDRDQPAIQMEWAFQRGPLQSDGETQTGPEPDPDTYRLTLEGHDTPFHVSGQGRFLHWQHSTADLQLPAELVLTGRNLQGRSTPARHTVLMPAPARRVQLRLLPESLAGPEGHLGVQWSVSGRAPLPQGRLVLASGTEWAAVGGLAGATLTPRPEGDMAGTMFRPDDASLPELPCDIILQPLPAPWRWRWLVSAGGEPIDSWSAKIWPSGGLPAGWARQQYPLIPHQPDQPVWVVAPGYLPLVDPDPTNPDTARTVAADERLWDAIPLTPSLLGKVILIDPGGGGSDPDGTGPLGTRGATLNLETALLAKKLFEGCGARVVLTRHAETALLPEDKVGLANDVRADLFLTVGRSPDAHVLTAAHHPTSTRGQHWAEMFAAGAVGLLATGDTVRVVPSYEYLLRHTACPALEIRLAGADSPQQEMRIRSRTWRRAEARAILLGVVSLLEGGDTPIPTLDPATIIASLPGAPQPADVIWAEFDGNWSWTPLVPLSPTGPRPLSSVSGPGLPDLTAQHTLEIRSAQRWQIWLVESNGSGHTGRLLMHRP